MNFPNSGNGNSEALARARVGNGNFSVFNVTGGRASTSFKLTVDINGIRFEDVKCDTGAPCSLMSRGMFDKFFDRNSLKMGRNVYTDYGNHPLAYIGEFLATVMYRNVEKRITFIVTNSNQPILLGESFLHPFGFKLMQVNTISLSEENKVFVVDKIKTEFSEVFRDELGRFSGVKVHLELKPDAKPKFF